jgi:CO dehydrogenase maturation factor
VVSLHTQHYKEKENMNNKKNSISADREVEKPISSGIGGGFRVVITGKGGAGKTTLTALLCYLFAKEKYKVLAIDQDSQMNLSYALGFSQEEYEKIIPLSENADYIEEKIGAKPGQGWGLFLSLNPTVDDVVKRFGVENEEGIKLLVMGTTKEAGQGCLCPENALLSAVMRYINLRKDEIILMDTQAGVEHFGRAMSEGFSQAIVITEPYFNSIQVALRTTKLTKQIGVKHIHLVINKGRNEKEKNNVLGFLEKEDFKFSSITYLPFEEKLLGMEPKIDQLLNTDSEFFLKTGEIFKNLKRYSKK